ncbi:MAG: hypothetical protein L0Y80_04140 [Ignavibacteriae bacterium]|nr:hypothetical protein [Ignavibacteriota bacterium]
MGKIMSERKQIFEKILSKKTAIFAAVALYKPAKVKNIAPDKEKANSSRLYACPWDESSDGGFDDAS